MLYEDLTREVIGVFYDVYNYFGPGFLEKVYENAMMIEFRRRGIKCVSQVPIKVDYRGEVVGNYVADLFVEDKVIVEIKATRGLSSFDNAQLINYLAATGSKVGLLFNYGEKPEFKTRVFNGRGSS